MAGKWNWKKHEYEEYKLPEGASMYSDNMDYVVACAECGKDLIYGEGFVSIRIHNDIGFGYMVCEACYRKEWEERQKCTED